MPQLAGNPFQSTESFVPVKSKFLIMRLATRADPVFIKGQSKGMSVLVKAAHTFLNGFFQSFIHAYDYKRVARGICNALCLRNSLRIFGMTISLS